MGEGGYFKIFVNIGNESKKRHSFNTDNQS